MAKTILKVRQGDVAFYLNESSNGARNTGRRFRLSRTSDHGKTKDGWIKINSTDHQMLVDAGGELAQFNACASLFKSKRQRPHVTRHQIRGAAGKWEGVAFPERKHIQKSEVASVPHQIASTPQAVERHSTR